MLKDCTKPGLGADQGGITLIELIITLAVGAILLSLAAPNLSSFVSNNRILSNSNSFVAAINLARGEAIRRGVTVVLCRTMTPAAGSPSCNRTASSANDWSTGWLMYATDGDVDERDYAAATDTLISVGGPLSGGLSFTSDSEGNNWLAFSNDGSLREAGPAAYAVCDDRGPAAGRLITVLMTGRPAVMPTTTDAATDCTPT